MTVRVDVLGRTSEVAGAILSVILGLLLLSAVVLGPLVTGRVRFHMSAEALVQYVGGEVVTVVVSGVVLVTAAGWWLGAQWAPALAGGAAAYVVYTFATVVGGQEYERYPGNVEKAFLLYAAVTAVGVALLVTSYRVLAAGAARPGPRHLTGWVLLTIAAVVALLWLGQLAGFYRDGPTPEYRTATSLFWLIKYLDLGIVIPLTVITGLLQRVPSAGTDAAAVTVLGFLSWLLAALFVMALEMIRRDVPGSSWALAVGAFVLLAPTAYLWARWLSASD